MPWGASLHGTALITGQVGQSCNQGCGEEAGSQWGVKSPVKVPYLNAKKFPVFAASAAQAKGQGGHCGAGGGCKGQREGAPGEGGGTTPRSSSEPQKIELRLPGVHHGPQASSAALLKDRFGERQSQERCADCHVPLGKDPGWGGGRAGLLR